MQSSAIIVPHEKFDPTKPHHINIVVEAKKAFDKKFVELYHFDFLFGGSAGLSTFFYFAGACTLGASLLICAPLVIGLRRFRRDYFQPEQVALGKLLEVYKWYKKSGVELSAHEILYDVEGIIQYFVKPQDRTITEKFADNSFLNFSSFFSSAKSLPSPIIETDRGPTCHDKLAREGARRLYGYQGSM